MNYVALLRGIAPSNPAMRNENMRKVAEGRGHRNVRTVISSGNLLFESDRADPSELEAEMEAAWPEKLGFTSTTIVRSRDQIDRMVAADPFQGLEHGRTSYLLVTFLKHPLSGDVDLSSKGHLSSEGSEGSGRPEPPEPSQASEPPFRVIGAARDALFSVTDTTVAGTPDWMGRLERRFGKEISSRTWKTVQRILAKM